MLIIHFVNIPRQRRTMLLKPKCAFCDKDISIKMANYSEARYGKPLCLDCQKEAIDDEIAHGKMPKKLGEFLKGNLKTYE